MNGKIFNFSFCHHSRLNIALIGYFVKQGMSNYTDFNRYVSVKGLAEKTIKTDQAVAGLNIKLHRRQPCRCLSGH